MIQTQLSRPRFEFMMWFLFFGFAVCFCMGSCATDCVCVKSSIRCSARCHTRDCENHDGDVGVDPGHVLAVSRSRLGEDAGDGVFARVPIPANTRVCGSLQCSRKLHFIGLNRSVLVTRLCCVVCVSTPQFHSVPNKSQWKNFPRHVWKPKQRHGSKTRTLPAWFRRAGG